MSIRVFIDGSAGTTGLRLTQRLSARADVELLQIDHHLRKDAAAKAKIANSADILFLCLPDDAAREAVANITNPDVKIIDASTAHRVSPGWVYGLPELSAGHRTALANSTRVANPGCYATGFIALAYPLVAAGVVPPDYPFSCHATSGYSGAGKGMIAKYEDPQRESYYNSPRQYALGLAHKHLPEMQKVAGLTHLPLFSPYICDYYAGMVVSLPLFPRLFAQRKSLAEIHSLLCAHYAEQALVRVMPLGAQGANPDAMIDPNGIAGKDDLEIYVCGNDEQILLLSRFDNLGKGASGAAVQSMNILCGLDETLGLSL
jgi:N-acetyl-gamma-glutamyl-phosphate reductase, uncommon form